MVYKPPLKRKMEYAITMMVITRDEGFVVEILSNQRLSENGIDVACFLIFFGISCSLVVQ